MNQSTLVGGIICSVLLFVNSSLHYEHTAFQTSNSIINMTPNTLKYLYVLEEMKYWQAGEKP
jgi:hypothetical protein